MNVFEWLLAIAKEAVEEHDNYIPEPIWLICNRPNVNLRKEGMVYIDLSEKLFNNE